MKPCSSFQGKTYLFTGLISIMRRLGKLLKLEVILTLVKSVSWQSFGQNYFLSKIEWVVLSETAISLLFFLSDDFVSYFS